ncbi:MAG TPA: signal peptidase II [Actinomycetota bacterium]|jgi:signal peptidase II|nr:signal peptidase II [Actinomycetota bacterium]
MTAVGRAHRRAAIWLFSAAGAVYVVDRLTKLWAERRLPGDPIDVIPGVVTFRFATNPGGAFSLGQDVPWFFVGASLIVSVLIVVTAFRHTNVVTALALGLVLGGALGNLTDRFARGARFTGQVVDFIDVQIWPVFNVADSAVVIGAIVLAVGSFVGERPTGAEEGVAPPARSDAPAVDER